MTLKNGFSEMSQDEIGEVGMFAKGAYGGYKGK